MLHNFFITQHFLVTTPLVQTHLQNTLRVMSDFFVLSCRLQTANFAHVHYSDVIMGAMASQITSLTIIYSTVYSGADKKNHQSSASLAFVRGIHRWPVNSPHKGPVTWKMFPFDNVITLLRFTTLALGKSYNYHQCPCSKVVLNDVKR